MTESDAPMQPRAFDIKERRIFLFATLGVLAIIAALAAVVFTRVIDGDAVGYANAVKVYQGTVELHLPPGLTENTIDVVTVHRILTTALGIEAIRVFSEIFGSLILGWVIWDTILFFGASILFYKLLERFFDSSKVAFVGVLFFAGNYSMVAQGLGLFMDIGGWFFYILSIFMLYLYIESGRYRDLFYAALAIAVGGFFKENAFVAAIPVACVALYEDYRFPVRFLQRTIPLGLVVVIPTALYHLYIYEHFGYLYTYWVRLAGTFQYSSIIVEYIKSLGSLLTLLAPLAAIGAIFLIRPIPGFMVDTKKKIFVAAVLVSAIPAVMWPAITQRVLFLAVPGLILIASFFVKRFEKYWYVFLPVAALYVIIGFAMDAYILNFVNLPF